MCRSLFRFGPMLGGILALAVLNSGSVLAAPEAQAQAGQGRTVVVGGIQPCSGLPPRMVHGLPRYAAGTVLVLQGHMTWGQWRHGVRTSIFPRHVVARETVRANTRYRFALLPGHYVLTARLPHSNVRPFVQITVAGQTIIRANIPNMCM